MVLTPWVTIVVYILLYKESSKILPIDLVYESIWQRTKPLTKKQRKVLNLYVEVTSGKLLC